MRSVGLGKALAVALVIFAAGLVVGLDVVHCALLAVAGAAMIPLGALSAADDDGWPEHEDDRADAGARREVNRLSWGLHGFESRVDRRSLAHLRGIATRRLHRLDVDLDDPADADRARHLLGVDAYAALTADPGAPPRYDSFALAVVAVEQLTERTTL